MELMQNKANSPCKRLEYLQNSQIILSLEHRSNLQRLGYNVSVSTIRRIFKRWGWSYKSPSVVQLQKYSLSNLCYYFNYLMDVATIPYSKIKFLDECHFAHRALKFEKAICEIGEPLIVVNKHNIDYRFSLTLMTTLTDPNLTITDLRDNSNTAEDFLQVSYIM